MPRKKKNELPSGSIRKQVYDHSEPVYNKDGNPVIDPKTGKQKRKRIYISITGSNKADVQLEALNIKQNKNVKKLQTDFTLRQAINNYIAKSKTTLSPSTINGYDTISKNAFTEIMDKKISNLNESVLQDAIDFEIKREVKWKKERKTLSPKTIRNEYGLLMAVLHYYYPNEVYNIKLPQKEKKFHDLATPQQIYTAVQGSDYELAVLLAMWLSFTVSEIRGLTKSKSLSNDGNYIMIVEVKVELRGKDVVKKQAKNIVRNRKHRLPDPIKKLIDKVSGDIIVPYTANAILRNFKSILQKNNLPNMTFHDLRHVNASVMAMLNVPDKYAQERGGWSSDHIMKEVYQETFSQERVAIDDKIDMYFENNLFKKSKYESKHYNCWLYVFHKEDSKDSRKEYDIFLELQEKELKQNSDVNLDNNKKNRQEIC